MPLDSFSAFWQRSSVVSVLISLISDTSSIQGHYVKCIFGAGRWNRKYCTPSENGAPQKRNKNKRKSLHLSKKKKKIGGKVVHICTWTQILKWMHRKKAYKDTGQLLWKRMKLGIRKGGTSTFMTESRETFGWKYIIWGQKDLGSRLRFVTY